MSIILQIKKEKRWIQASSSEVKYLRHIILLISGKHNNLNYINKGLPSREN